jgi:class 3 adenylate cyclase
MTPEIRYAHSGDVNIAYQVIGDAPRDLVMVLGWASNIEVLWEEAAISRFVTRLASFARVILFDKRGTGLSDGVAHLPGLEVRMDDVRAVMDAAGSERAALFGVSEGGPMCALFAATYPERTSMLIMAGSYARRTSAPDYPWGITEAELEAFVDRMQRDWGGPVGIEARAPTMARDERFRQWWARYLRMSTSPAGLATLTRMNADIDIRHVLPTIRVPTLILHSRKDQAIHIGGSRYMAERIPNAKLVELTGLDHLPWLSDADTVIDEIEAFLTGERHTLVVDRVLATMLFTDIVNSTARAAAVGDRRWHDLLDSHHALARSEIARFRGREVKTAGDGFLATFDGPARAVRCACAISDEVRKLGLEVRAGIHTGECEMMGDDISGIAVHIGARVASVANAGEVLVSSTVRDLVAGSGLRFRDRGTKALKGVPGKWHLFAVERDPPIH